MAIAATRRSHGGVGGEARRSGRLAAISRRRRLGARPGGLVGRQEAARDVALDFAELGLVEGGLAGRAGGGARTTDQRPDRDHRGQSRHSR